LSAVSQSGFDPTGVKPAPKDDPKVLENLLNDGDIVISRSNTPDRVGLAGIYRGNPSPCAYPDLLMRVRLRSSLIPEFLLYRLLSFPGRRFFSDNARGSSGSMVKIDRTILKSFPVLLPPLIEQRQIVAALNDVDALVSGLDRHIAKKRDLKQAAMQQLLTGQRRLPEFSGAWRTMTVGDGVSLFSGQHILAQYCNTEGRGFPYLTGPSDFPDGKIRQTKYTEKPSALCEADDILVTVKGSGSGTLVVADGVYCISRQLMAIRVRDWDRKFVYYSLLQNATKIKSASTGLIPGLSRADILEQILPVPPLVEEQAAVATVLSDMDAELTALEARRDKVLALKQGMMQELLTGRTRLVAVEGDQNA